MYMCVCACVLPTNSPYRDCEDARGPRAPFVAVANVWAGPRGLARVFVIAVVGPVGPMRGCAGPLELRLYRWRMSEKWRAGARERGLAQIFALAFGWHRVGLHGCAGLSGPAGCVGGVPTGVRGRAVQPLSLLNRLVIFGPVCVFMRSSRDTN